MAIVGGASGNDLASNLKTVRLKGTGKHNSRTKHVDNIPAHYRPPCAQASLCPCYRPQLSCPGSTCPTGWEWLCGTSFAFQRMNAFHLQERLRAPRRHWPMEPCCESYECSELDWRCDDDSSVVSCHCDDGQVLGARRRRQIWLADWTKRGEPGGRDWNCAGDIWLRSRLRSHFRAEFRVEVEWKKRFGGDVAEVGPGVRCR